jgi:O-antigen ligase
MESAFSPQSSDDPMGHQRVVEAFRGGRRTQDLHPREKTILWLVALHLTFLAWAFGGRNIWAQLTSLGLGALSFGVALLPREIPRTVDQPGMRLIPWRALRGSVLFWAGLFILLLVVVQGLNPAWTFTKNGDWWWMTKTPFVQWLQRGTAAPWARDGGPWHTLVKWSAVWLTACTVLIGLTRRRALRLLLVSVAANGVGVALLGLVQQFFGNGRIYWSVVSVNPQFFGSFMYKNHGGTWLNLCLGATAGLAGWHYLRGLRRMDKSNPSGLFAFLALVIGVSVFASFARGATLMMLVFVGAAILAVVAHQLRTPPASRRPEITIVLLLFFGVFLRTGLQTLPADEAWTRFNNAITGGDASLHDRQLLTRASLLMYRDHWLWGTGAGSFRYLFGDYQRQVPELWPADWHVRFYYEHAHNDLLEFPIELGLAGTLAVLAIAGAGIVKLIRNYFWENPLSLALVLTLLLTAIHAWWEFVWQNHAILMLYAVLAVVAVRWAEIEEGA